MMEESVARGAGLTEADIHDLLRNDRRRNVIEHLRSRADGVTLRDISETIAELETGESPPPRNVRDSVYNSLHQTHLPKLHRTGVVVYDDDRKTVELDERVDRVSVYMEVLGPYGVSWAQYYRALALVALTLVVALASDLPVATSFDVRLVASAFLLLISVSTAYQLWSKRWTIVQRLTE
jgi:hypothetical protein